jgi:CDP-diglyceride synthetase
MERPELSRPRVGAAVAFIVGAGTIVLFAGRGLDGWDWLLFAAVVVIAVLGGRFAASKPAPLSQATLAGLIGGMALAVVRVVIGIATDHSLRAGGVVLLVAIVTLAAVAGGVTRTRSRPS